MATDLAPKPESCCLNCSCDMTTYNDFSKEWSNDVPYIKAMTSGSTGVPKEIRLLKTDMKASADATNAYFGIDENSVLVTPLSADYIAGKMMAVRAWACGASLVVVPPANVYGLPSGDITLLAVVPSQTDHLINNPKYASRVKNVLVGGAPLSENRRRALIEAGYMVYESYGMTETCSHVALRRIDEEYFEAMPGIKFDTDKNGCLIIQSNRLSCGTLLTKDCVTLKDSQHMKWLGRADNVINSGGIKIHPEQLERDILHALSPSVQFYVTQKPHDKWGNVAVLVVEGEQRDADALLSAVREILPHSHAPRQAIAVQVFDRTYNGKIKRGMPKE